MSMNLKKRFFSAAIIILCAGAWANVFSSARTVSVLKTEYFDIIFPKKCSVTAYKLAGKADAMFEKAANRLGLENYFRMPVVISPDSETLYVEYTPNPYNRIVIYAALPEKGQHGTEDALLSEFYKEVLRAVASSIRSPFWQTVARQTSNDFIQPVTLLNMPYSFMVGAVNTFSEDGSLLNDKFSMQILSQAKSEGNFPAWTDCLGARDIHREAFADIAGTAFAAFLQQRYGMEKYSEFWQESGKVHLFKINAGIFKKVYGIPIAQIWGEFVESIPVFPSVEAGEALIGGNTKGLYELVRSTKDGIFFYDSARSCVCVIADGKKPKYLFTASGVNDLQISPDGKYIAISFTADRTQKNLSVRKAKIFNVKRGMFEGTALSMRSVSFVTCADGTLASAGITEENGFAVLSVYTMFADSGASPIFSYTFKRGELPAAAISAAPGKIICPVYHGRKCSLKVFEMNKTASNSAGNDLESYTSLPVQAYDFKKAALNIDGEEKDVLMFTYAPEEVGKNAAAGFVLLDKSKNPSELYLQHSSYSGGNFNSSVYAGKMYFVNHKYAFYELKKKDFDISEFTKSDFMYESAQNENDNSTGITVEENEANTKIEKRMILNRRGNEKKAKFLREYRLYRYNPVPYMFKGSWIPFFSISSLTLEKNGYILAPSLGFTYLTNTDPLEQNKGAISFGVGFMDPKNNYRVARNNYNLSAYFTSSHLPVDIIAGGSWSFTNNGEYKIQALMGTNWNIPLGMNFHKTAFTADFLWNCKTEYLDTENQVKIIRDGWINLNDAFHSLDFIVGLEYSNYRRYGFSSYEMLGFGVKGEFLCNYDFEKLHKADTDGYSEPLQIVFNSSAGAKIPFIIPVFGVENWILCLPATISSEWKLKDGTTSNSFVEALLAGYEIQRGIPGVNLYLQRGGITLGYDIHLKYNELVKESPDIRDFDYFIRMVKSSEFDDYIYSNITLEFTPLLGNFSRSLRITSGVRFQYHIKTNTTKANFILRLNI